MVQPPHYRYQNVVQPPCFSSSQVVIPSQVIAPMIGRAPRRHCCRVRKKKTFLISQTRC
ncbi:hypothetical protein HanXRQr2_Chr11g0501171 [Helianthus annuus]|uniref:Uncharacterized protein n=1 Tax=Helianthus annuus TaxID=4232 RepID=A0A9K3N0V4_HELAN|nr:hypothetical protein HanXRQr2_Chr11g0501171 [Helianthus annuus]KAJ0875965.1 hypothetical protein HanPSC8_Chr11g0482951 [Helianthus annuus]